MQQADRRAKSEPSGESEVYIVDQTPFEGGYVIRVSRDDLRAREHIAAPERSST